MIIKEQDNIIEIVTFQLGKETYGIDINHVHEVIRLVDITHVPRARQDIEGVINLRGNIIPIVDLRKRLNLEKKDDFHTTRIIILDLDGLIGILVDAVLEVRNIDFNSLESPLVFTTEQNNNSYILGIAKQEDVIITLLDIQKILNLE